MAEQKSNNIADILTDSTSLLHDADISSASLDTRLLLAYALAITQEEIIAHLDRVLTDQEKEAFEILIKRRVQREPLSHIIGKREFWSRDFIVNGYVLDPRPDSETLIEAALSLDNVKTVLDLGTGSGCLIITLLAEWSETKGTAIDTSAEALDIASKNAKKHGVEDRLIFINGSWTDVSGKFDLIISNPPYIPTQDITQLEPEISKYEPKQALDGGTDGLDCYRDIIPLLSNVLAENGHILFECGQGQADAIGKMLKEQEFSNVSYRKDLAGIDRCIMACQG